MQKLVEKLKNNFVPNTRLMILGPMGVDAKNLKVCIKKLEPTLILLIDGGTKHKSLLTKKEQAITISLGDGDSSKILSSNFDILLPKEKNYSDLAFAIEIILKSKKYFDKISMMGFINPKQSKERIDHLFCNIGIIHKLSMKLSFPILMDEKFLFLPKGVSTINHRGLFSVLSVQKNLLKITGKAKYQLPEWTKLSPLSSLGLSNLAAGKIFIESTRPLVVYFPVQ